MSAIDGTGSGDLYSIYNRSGMSARQPASQDEPDHDSEDVVEISREAQEKLREQERGRSLMNPTKTLRRGTEAYDKFQELLHQVKTQKSDISSRLDEALRKSGIDLTGKGKLKLEVDKSGKIVAGGLSDERIERALEAALNKDPSLAADIADYQKNEKQLSKQVQDYTGCSLYELAMTSQGNISNRIREELEDGGKYMFDSDYYMGLGFLGSDSQVISLEEIRELSFTGGIDFSGEISVMADPESSIKETLGGLLEEIQVQFDNLNATIMKELKARGIAVDDETAGQYLLSMADVGITVDSQGGLVIEGSVSSDEQANQRGMAIIERVFRDMLGKTDDNSYHVNIFLAASGNLLKYNGSSDTSKVFARIAGGTIRVGTEESEASRVQTRARKGLEQAQSSVLQ